MWKAALVGAVALATAGTGLATSTVRAEEVGYVQRQVGVAMSSAQIGRFKAALRLSREQERHWPAVAAALRHIRVGGRAAAVAINSWSLQQLVSAAMPLFETLDENQKRVALRLVESIGFGAFVAGL
jgi:hypothetical protein